MSDRTDNLSNVTVRFARSATRHRVSKESIRHVIVNHSIRFAADQETGCAVGATRLLGDDPQGHALEVMAIQLSQSELLVIHAMALREKYKRQYEEAKRWRR